MSTMLLVMALCAPVEKQLDTVVVCPQEFRQALQPWLEHRRQQGHEARVITNAKSADGLRDEIRRIAADGKLRYLVLIGDADPKMDQDEAVRKRSIPTHLSQAVVNVKFGSAPQIATDNWYADLDDDRTPDLAVGRLTCDSASELTRVVQKILDYERSTDYGHWRRHVHFVAGLGGFGAVADSVLEASAKSLISEGIPAPYCTTMTYGSWQSPYCPDPREFHRVTMDRLNEGSLFWVYIGHGQQRAVDQVRTPGGSFPILASGDVSQLSCQHGAPIACFLACHSGAFDAQRDCLAEEMLRTPGAPVAILCGSRVTMPYAMSVMGSELLRQCFVERAETIGDALLAAKRRMMQTEGLSKHRSALDAVARALSPTAAELEAERSEHLDLFNLIGDPLLRIAYPKDVQVEAPSTALPGESITITVNTPLAGEGTIELSVRRDRLTFPAARRGKFDPNALAEYTDVYQRANQPRLVAAQYKLAKGSFSTQLKVPAEANGACHVRVFVEGPEGCAVGAADVRIEKPEKE